MKLIDGVVVRTLKKNADERGYLMEILRADWEGFERFGQSYVSLNYPGVIRAWHYHKKQTDYFVCVAGMITVPLYDGRKESPTHGEINEFVMGNHNPLMVKIPPGVYHGYKTLGVTPSLLINLPTEVYDPKAPDEFREPWNTKMIPYNWEVEFK
jgi:dTDP-4-dehydrorhamnose 3,5-epimerase